MSDVMEPSDPNTSSNPPSSDSEEFPHEDSQLMEVNKLSRSKGQSFWAWCTTNICLKSNGIVTAILVGGSVLYVLLTLHPELLVANTTPTGGDMGAHVWGPAFLREHLLPQGQLSGWSPDWYAGFPAYHFYMVLPALAIVALDVLFPYGVAFKLVTISGILAMPIAAYVLGRLVRLPFPTPALMAVGATMFLFDRSFTIYGGNIASTMAGEFSFTISLSIALVYLGLIIRGVHTGKQRALAAALFALVVLCHVIPALFALGATVVVWLLYGPRRSFLYLATLGVVGSAITGFWAIPFLIRRGYMTNMAYEKMTHFAERLVPGRIGLTWSELFGGKHDPDITSDITILFVLALVGAGISIFYSQRFGIFLTGCAALFAIAFVLLPDGRLWNPRLLPFWYLCLYLLAALAVSEAVQSVAVLLADRSNQPNRFALAGGTVLSFLVALVVISLPLRVLPGGKPSADGTYSWLGISTKDNNFVRGWAEWNYSGYERKEAFPEYRDVIATMKWIGENQGCGRAMWEYEADQNRFGTTMALMLLPYWTDGCIGSMEGLYFESASTTPYHFLNAAELSKTPSNPQRGLPYGSLDIDKGVDHLQLLGVKYYMAFSSAAVAEADQNAELQLAASTGKWRMYTVKNSPLVEALGVEPAVLTGIDPKGVDWLEPSVDWYVNPESWKVPLASGGPSSWPRVEVGKKPEVDETRKAKVTNIKSDTDSISFDVDRPGTPVVVKASYFPNWKASGAQGPWRITPSMMVVVPTSNHVELSYGSTGVDWFARLVTLIGIAALIMFLRKPLTIDPIEGDDFDSPDSGPSDSGASDIDTELGQSEKSASHALGDG